MNSLFNSILLWWSKTITKLGGRVVASLVAAMIMTLIAVAFTDSWIVAIAKEDSKVQLLNENLLYINSLKASLFQAESAQRGFLVTQKAEYLPLFNNALAQARSDIKSLRANFDNDLIENLSRAEIELTQKTSANLEAKATEMTMTLNLAKSGDIHDANQIVNMGQGQIESNLFTSAIDRLNKLQLQQLAEVHSKHNEYILLSRSSLIGTAIALSFLVMVVIRQLVNEIANRDNMGKALALERITLQANLDERTRLLETLAVDYQYDVERERRQLARDLHDELGSILTATKMDISWVIRKFKEIAPEAAEKLLKTMRYLDQGIQFKRRIVEELHPSILTTFGFWPAMKSFVESAAERNEWELELSLPEESTQISEAIGLIAYRIVQETLNNATKYAKATKVSLVVIVDFNHLKLEIEDNGVGMDIHQMNTDTHGLTGMRHRVQAIGGQLEILSKLGEGVVTRALLPLESKLKANALGEQDIKIKMHQTDV